MAVVADPDEKAKAKLACSRAAKVCSKMFLKACQKTRKVAESDIHYRFGFELLVYSYAPRGKPTDRYVLDFLVEAAQLISQWL